MNLTDLAEIKQLLAKYGVRPNKKLGQNFLLNSQIISKALAVADINSDDLVLEVGPGIGCLTLALAQKAKAVFACESDPMMTHILSQTVGKYKQVRIFKGDVRSKAFWIEFSKWLNKRGSQKYKIVSNIPYNITSHFVRTFLTYPLSPQSMVLMVQKEVAMRMSAQPPNMSILGVSVQAYSRAKMIADVPKNNFYPVPQVNSALIKLDLTKGFLKENPDIEEKFFFQMVKMGFSSKRKALYNNLSAGYKISKEEIKRSFSQAGILENIRAQELTMEQWYKLYKGFNKK